MKFNLKAKSKVGHWLAALVMVLGLAFSNHSFGAYTITQGTDPNWCTSTYPTSYNSVSFSISESGTVSTRRGFNPGQTNRTLILGFSNAIYQFNPGIGTITATGTEVTINSFTVTSTAITVNITTAGSNNQLNTINFSNIQVRATAAGTGYIRRTGGTFTVDRSTTRPPTTNSFTTLTSTIPLAYSSAATTQSTTANVAPSASNQQIIRVGVTLTGGSCVTRNVSSFVFNTSGSTNAATDIANAKLYYTGTSTNFNTTTLFGTASNPNGSFTISGSQTLSAAGTYYFWLTYDIAALPTNGNVVDAQATSAVIGGTTFSLAGNPAGSRTIVTTTYYSISGGNGNWASTGNWSLTSNSGASCNCTPATGSLVQIAHTINLNTNANMTNVTILNGGTLNNSFGALTVNGLLATFGNGSFTAASIWTIQDLMLSGSGSATFSGVGTQSINGLCDLDLNTTLNRSTSAGAFTMIANVNIDGVLALNNNSANITGSSSTIDGVGSVTGTGTITITNDKSIPLGATLTINPTVTLAAATNVTSNAYINLGRSLTGSSTTTSIWTNATGSTLEMSGATSTLLTTGILTATANNNLVIYSGSGTQNVKSTSYFDVSFRNATKVLLGDITVLDELSITGAGVLDVSSGNNYSISVAGNWVNNSSAASPFLYRQGTVNFTGNSTIQGSAVSAFDNVSVQTGGILVGHATAGFFQISGDFNVSGDYQHNNSDITFIPSSAIGGNNTSNINQSAVIDFFTVIISTSKTLVLPSGNITISGNLTNNGTLNANGGFVSFTGSASTQTFGGTTTSNTLENLAVDNSGGTLVIANPLTVIDSLIFSNGIITTPSSSITVAVSGSATGGSSASYVSGLLKRVCGAVGSYTFPVGKGGVYRPVVFTYSSLTGTSTVSVEQFESALSGTLPVPSVLNNSRYWSISQTGGSGISYKVRLDGTGDVISGTIVILKNESGVVTATTAIAPNYTNSVNFTSLTGTCNFTTGSICSVASNAGVSQIGSATCGLSTVTLNATTPSSGTGNWSIASGVGGSFSAANSATSTFTGSPGVPYSLLWTVTDGNCTAGSFVDVTLGYSGPTMTAASGSASVCQGSSTNLTATQTPTVLINANFNAGSNGFTTSNTSTGGTSSASAWTLRPDGTVINTLTFNSNDGTQFYVSDSRSQSGSTTNTTLTSPMVNTNGYAALTLSFYHYFRYQGFLTNESANVQVSTNGTNWTTIPGGSFTSTQGSSANFANATFDLSSYVGNTVFYVRFFYNVVGGIGRYWAIDNVSLTGTQSLTYSWTSSPGGFTSTTQNPSAVSPTVNTAYTVVATNSFGCSATSNSTSVTIDLPTTPTISISSDNSSICSGTVFTSSVSSGGASPSYQWRKNNNPISGATSSSYTGVGIALNDAISCVLTSNATCITTSNATSNDLIFSNAGVPSTTWTGANNSSWSDAANWSAGVPTSNVSVVIPSGTLFTPSITSNSDVYHLTINSGASLQVAGSNALNLYGNLVNDGSMTMNGSTVNLLTCPGTSGFSHTISSTNSSLASFANVTLNDPAGVTLNTDAQISDGLTLTSGTFTNNNKTFTFLSNSTKTAYIAPVTGGSYIGNITMQRYVPAGNSGWKILGSPVTNTSLADWYNNNSEIYMSGFPGASYAVGSNVTFTSVYTYNESNTGIADSGFVAPSNITDPITNSKGYFVFMGTSVSNLNALTFDVTGTPKIGNASFPVTYTSTANSLNDGWNVVANPYPCTIDWNSTGWTKTNVNNYFYVYNPTINNYATFTSLPNDSTNGGTRYIPSSQGFIVKASAASPVLACAETVKSTSQPSFKSQTSAAVGLRLKIEQFASSLTDEAIVRFESSATDGIDALDADKFYPMGNAVNIATISDNKLLTYNFLNTFDNQIHIPVKVSIPSNGIYSVTISNLQTLMNEYPFYFSGNTMLLEDLSTGVVTPLNSNSTSYQFYELNGQKTRNFVLRFQDASVVTDVATKSNLFELVNVYQFDGSYHIAFDMPNETNASISIYNSRGQLVKPVETVHVLSTVTKLSIEGLVSGIYVVKVNVGNKQVTKKIVLE